MPTSGDRRWPLIGDMVHSGNLDDVGDFDWPLYADRTSDGTTDRRWSIRCLMMGHSGHIDFDAAGPLHRCDFCGKVTR